MTFYDENLNLIKEIINENIDERIVYNNFYSDINYNSYMI